MHICLRFIIAAFFLVLSIEALPATDTSGVKELDDNKDHWLFQFDMSSKKPLGTKEDARAVYMLSYAETEHMSHSAMVTGVMVGWITPSQVVTRADFVDTIRGAFLFVLEKREASWLIVHHYHIPKYLPKQRDPR